MKIKELIEKLRKFNDSKKEVKMWIKGELCNVLQVREDTFTDYDGIEQKFILID